MNYIYAALIGYSLGCINMAYIIGKLNGVDIRDKGSHNAGASNVTITLGWLPGILTGAFDIAKSFLAFWITKQLFGGDVLPFLAAVFAILGHIFPFYLNFKGGKGFASYIGMCLAYNWKLGLVVMAVTVVITLVTDYIALATMASSIYVPAYLYFIHMTLIVVGMLAALAILIIWKHRTNIRNIIKGEEIGFRNNKKHRIKT